MNEQIKKLITEKFGMDGLKLISVVEKLGIDEDLQVHGQGVSIPVTSINDRNSLRETLNKLSDNPRTFICSVNNDRVLIQMNTKKSSFLIPQMYFNKYNADTCIQIIFSEEGLKELRNIYKRSKALPGFLHNLLKGRPGHNRDEVLANPKLYFWKEDMSFLIIPNIKGNNGELLKSNHRALSNLDEGFALTAWIMDPRLLATYGLEQGGKNEPDGFKNFLVAHDKTNEMPATYSFIKRTDSQDDIMAVEKTGKPYLASVLDLSFEHIDSLKTLQTTVLSHLQETFGVSPDKDLVDLYFHFPYGEATLTLHLHIRVNQGRHPIERRRSISIQELIQTLEQGKQLNEFILERNPYYIEKNETKLLGLLQEAKGISCSLIPNPIVLSSPSIENSEPAKRVNTMPATDIALS